jgi:hypothetical protein
MTNLEIIANLYKNKGYMFKVETIGGSGDYAVVRRCQRMYQCGYTFDYHTHICCSFFQTKEQAVGDVLKRCQINTKRITEIEVNCDIQKHQIFWIARSNDATNPDGYTVQEIKDWKYNESLVIQTDKANMEFSGAPNEIAARSLVPAPAVLCLRFILKDKQPNESLSVPQMRLMRSILLRAYATNGGIPVGGGDYLTRYDATLKSIRLFLRTFTERKDVALHNITSAEAVRILDFLLSQSADEGETVGRVNTGASVPRHQIFKKIGNDLLSQDWSKQAGYLLTLAEDLTTPTPDLVEYDLSEAN